MQGQYTLELVTVIGQDGFVNTLSAQIMIRNEETGLYPCNIVSDRISCFDVNTIRK